MSPTVKRIANFDEYKIFATTEEDLEQDSSEVPEVMHGQVPVFQKAQRTVDSPTDPTHCHARLMIFGGCAQTARRR